MGIALEINPSLNATAVFEKFINSSIGGRQKNIFGTCGAFMILGGSIGLVIIYAGDNQSIE